MSRTNKSSVADNERKRHLFEAMSKQQRDRFASPKNLFDVTPWMEGSIILSLLQEKDGGRPNVMAEINARQIKYEFVPAPNKRVRDMTKKEKEKYNKGFDGISITDLKKLLKRHEQERLAIEEEKVIKAENMQNIKPLSTAMKEFMPKQWTIYK
jgi:molybdopterin converting factor small subunit